jgi:hypothetical protein
MEKEFDFPWILRMVMAQPGYCFFATNDVVPGIKSKQTIADK